MHRTSILQLVLQKCEANLTEMLFTKREEAKLKGPVYMEWFLLFSRSGGHKKKKLTPLDRGPPLHVNRVLNWLASGPHLRKTV